MKKHFSFNEKLIKRITLIPSFIIFILLLIYIVYRAYYLSFTHDEAISYWLISGQKEYTYTANNHLLNTYLMGVSQSFFGKSEIALRLPNVLSFVLFGLGLYLIFKREKRVLLFSFSFLFILLNPFMLEFFSLARGYGLSIGFFTMSIYFTLRNAFSYSNLKFYIIDFIGAIIFGLLSTLSNLSLINFYISVLLVFSFKLFLNRKKIALKIKHWTIVFTTFIFSILPIVYIIKHLLFLSEKKELYFGSESFTDIFNTLFELSIYYPIEKAPIISFIILLIFILYISGIALVIIFRRLNSQFAILLILIASISTGMFLEYYLFDAQFPIERSVLFLWPIIGLLIYFLIQLLHDKFKIMTYPLFSLGILLLIPLVLNFKHGYNLESTRQWRYDTDTKEVLLLISKNSIKSKPVIIKCNFLYYTTFHYYKDYLKLDNFLFYPEDYQDVKAGFYYRLQSDEMITDFVTLKKFNVSATELLVRKN